MRTIIVLLLASSVFACQRRETTVAAPTATVPQQTATGTLTGPPEDLSTAGAKEISVPVTTRDLFFDRAMLGSAKASDGTTADDRREFKSGEPISLTVWFKQSPPGLRSSVKWYGSGEKVLHEEGREMKGAKVVTFSAPAKLAKGRYRVVALWGGNEAADLAFKVK